MTVTTLHQLAQLLDAQVRNRPADQAVSVCLNNNSIDSRTIEPGDLFWALPGENHDGHQFVNMAFARGARAAVVSDGNVAFDGPILQVNDVTQALQSVATWHRNQFDALLIGVTGSVGKTTTRNLLHQTLSTQFEGMQSERNYNNQLGVPLSLLQLNSHHEYGVIEMGASAPGNIAELAEFVQPEIGVLTQIGPAHLDGFGTIDNVIRTKAELLAAVPKSGFVVLPEHLSVLPGIAQQISCRAITVGTDDQAVVQAQQVRYENGRLEFRVAADDYSLNVPGRHFLNAALISLAIAREFGIDAATIQTGFEQFAPVAGRCAVHSIGPWTVIDDTYNANPLSMMAGLHSLCDLPGVTQRIAVLGDMLCLGDQAARYHQKLGQEIARMDVDFLLAYGQHASQLAHGAYRAGMSGARIGVFDNIYQLQEILELWLAPHSGILLKASRAIQLERLLPWLEEQAASHTEGSSILTTPFPLKRAG